MASDPYVAAILTGLIRLIGSLFGTILLKKFPRKLLMMTSAFLMAFDLVALALTVYYKERIAKHEPKTVQEEGLMIALRVLPLIEIILYILFFGLGVGTVPWLLLGELCPVKAPTLCPVTQMHPN